MVVEPDVVDGDVEAVRAEVAHWPWTVTGRRRQSQRKLKRQDPSFLEVPEVRTDSFCDGYYWRLVGVVAKFKNRAKVLRAVFDSLKARWDAKGGP